MNTSSDELGHDTPKQESGALKLKEITSGPLHSVAELVDLSESFDHSIAFGQTRGLAFRGQPQEFGTLTPSFRRQFVRESVGTAAIIESRLIDAFRVHYAELKDRSQDMPWPNQIDRNFDLRCLSVMQHYEIPTRLLDWTSNFWTAVYFACASDPGSNAELWCYDRRLFDLLLQENPDYASFLDFSPTPVAEPQFLSLRGEERLVELDPQITPRMKQQAAHHTVSANVFADHAPLLAKLAAEAQARGETYLQFRRVTIGTACKGKALQFLAEHKQITASTIFPDVVGLGRFLRWQFESLRTMMF